MGNAASLNQEQNPPRILVIEDDRDISCITAERLRDAGYACDQAFSGREAIEALQSNDFDLIICDLMLPDIPGEKIISGIRSRSSTLPVIVASARGSTSDKVDLLGIGADDYLAKPFDLEELVARVAVQLRHSATGKAAAQQHAGIAFLDWRLDTEGHTLFVRDAPLSLTKIEYAIIELLIRHPGRVYSRPEIFEAAWGEPYADDAKTVNVHVANIRSKLKASGTDGYLQTVWGVGFKLAEPVSEIKR